MEETTTTKVPAAKVSAAVAQIVNIKAAGLWNDAMAVVLAAGIKENGKAIIDAALQQIAEKEQAANFESIAEAAAKDIEPLVLKVRELQGEIALRLAKHGAGLSYNVTADESNNIVVTVIKAADKKSRKHTTNGVRITAKRENGKGKVFQYRKGDGEWMTADTAADACRALGIEWGSASANAVLKNKENGYETRYVEKAA